MKLKELVEAELTPIKLILDTVPPLFRREAAASLERGDQNGSIARRRALSLELESVLIHLNITVEGLLLLLASRLKGKGMTAEYSRAQRSVWLGDLEKAFDFKGDQLPGWSEVNQTREDVNLVKHRLGLEIVVGTATPLDVRRTVDLTEAAVLQLFLGIHRWLVELSTICNRLDD